MKNRKKQRCIKAIFVLSFIAFTGCTPQKTIVMPDRKKHLTEANEFYRLAEKEKNNDYPSFLDWSK